jgi:IclR family KDG regulon transcriptional repressor
MAESPPEYIISALEDGLRVLELVGRLPNLKLPQLAAEAGMTKSKVYRILQTLAHRNYVWFDDDHAAHLGPAALILGQQAHEQHSLTQTARPVLDALADQTGENIHLVVREGEHSLVIDVRTSPHPVRMFARIGRIGPLHAGGSPKVLLAYAPSEVVETLLRKPLERFTESTITDPVTLQRELHQIRADGAHVAISDLEEETFSIAAPIFNFRGQVVASLSVAGPLMRLNTEKQRQYLEGVQVASTQLSRKLGMTDVHPVRV